jgi:hypothetical protein
MIPKDVFDAARNANPRKTAKLVQVPYIRQQTANWCWAACVQMVVAAHQYNSPDQCELANLAFHRNDCCIMPTPAPCDQGFSDLCQLFTAMQFNCRSQGVPMLPVEIQDQVRSGRPIIYNIEWPEAEHTGVISDIQLAEGIWQVYFLDPDQEFFQTLGRLPYGWVSYDWVLNGYGFGGNWTTTWFDIEQ